MHTLHEKKGRKVVTHHFNHIKVDGEKRHVYLGTDQEKGRQKLVKLRAAHIKSKHPLIKEADELQSKLHSISHHGRPYDDLLTDIRQSYARQQHAGRVLQDALKDSVPAYKYAMIILAAAFFGAGLFYVLTSPRMTGAAVQAFDAAASSQAIRTTLLIAAGVVLLGLTFYAAEYRHHHKYDSYKPH
jgi:hypothetical protein